MLSINSCWSNRYPKISKLGFAGYFSINNDLELKYDASQLRYYYPLSKIEKSELNFDLNKGIELAKKEPCQIPYAKNLDHVLKWILSNLEKIVSEPTIEQWLKPDFVMGSGLTTTILKSPYEKKTKWIICAAKFKGTIYLNGFSTEDEKEDAAKASEFQLKCEYWGQKFKQYLTTNDPLHPPNSLEPLNKKLAFRCLLKRNLNGKKLLFPAEIGALQSDTKLDEPLDLCNKQFVQFKTTKAVKHRGDQVSLEKLKFLRWWCQSYMIGAKEIICGHRDKNGIIESIKTHLVSDLGLYYKRYWDGAVCASFLDGFLDFVQKAVKDDHDKTIYKFERIPEENVVVTEVAPDSEFAFLPSWYTGESPD